MQQHSRPHGHQDTSIDISPDGNTLVFNAAGEGGRDLYLMDLTMRRVRKVAATPLYEVTPSFSPDGKSIVYAAGKPGDRADHIFICSVDGSNARQLTSDDANDAFPRISPDGALIAFARDTTYDWGGLAANWAPGGVICLMNADGTNLRSLTSEKAAAYYPHFDADGQHVRFWSDGHLHWLKLAQPRTSKRFTARVSGDAVYSPNGELIAFSAGQYSPDLEIFIINSDGTDRRQVTKTDEGCSWPVFTPDSKKLLFLRESWPTGPTGVPKYSVWEINVDGSNLRRIADTRLFDAPLAWTPDAP
jgi:Tol biopolymer transport system component